MTFYRLLPNNNNSRYKAIETAKRKAAHLAPDEDMPITPTTESHLNNVGEQYLAAYQEITLALARQLKANDSAVKSKALVKIYISHFIQVFNFGIERGNYSLQDRSFYGLSVSDGTVPVLNSETEIIQWGNNIINGDAERITAGGVPMANPSIEELMLRYYEMIQLIETRNRLENAYDMAQERLNSLNEVVDKLILRIWNEINTFYDDRKYSNRRRKAREWGVVYVSAAKNPLVSGNVLNLANDSAIAGAVVSFKEIKGQTITDSAGMFSFKTDYSGEATIVVEKVGFASNTYIINTENNSTSHIKVHLTATEQVLFVFWYAFFLQNKF